MQLKENYPNKLELITIKAGKRENVTDKQKSAERENKSQVRDKLTKKANIIESDLIDRWDTINNNQ